MSISATLTIIEQGAQYTFQWHEQAPGLPPVTLLATQRVDPTLQQRIERAVALLNELLSQRTQGGAARADAEAQADPLQPLGRLLFQQLLPPTIQEALSRLPVDSTLTIATNTLSLPWEIAQNEQGYIALSHRISRQLLSDRSARHGTPSTGRQWSALLIGNPTGNLPESAAEIEAVATLIEALPGAAAPRILMQRRATKATILQELAGGQYDLIHYAGHAQVHATDATASGLLLAKGEILTAAELAQSLAGAPFVFLNGCESARAVAFGNAVTPRLDNVQPRSTPRANALPTGASPLAPPNLVDALLVGGARGLLGAYWPIYDRTSQEFAILFYRALLQGETVDAAVQAARRVLHQRFPADPLWAAFTLYAKAGDSLTHATQRLQRPGTILALDLTRLWASYTDGHGEAITRQIDHFHHQLGALARRFNSELIPLPTPQILIAFAATTAQNDCARAAQMAQVIFDDELTPGEIMPLLGGIGISSGDLYWPTEPMRRAQMAAAILGQPVHSAIALAQRAADQQILLDDAAQRLLHHHYRPGTLRVEPWHELPELPRVFRLYPVSSAHFQSTQALYPPEIDTRLPFVGRESELATLRAIWHQTAQRASRRQGQGALVGLTGEAGIGKSRLVQSFAAQLSAEESTHRPRWLSLRIPSTYQSTPYEVVIQLLRLLFAEQIVVGKMVRANDGFDVGSLTALISALPGMQGSAQIAVTVALICELFDIPAANGAIAHLDLQTRQRRLVHLLGTLLAQMVEHAPAIVWIDDLHWADESSLELLDQLTAGMDRLPLLFLTTFRSDGAWQPPWWRRRNYQQIHLDVLTDQATIQLFHELLQSTELVESLQETLLERSGGHPLFAQELVHALTETGTLVQQPSGWRLDVEPNPALLPGTIQRLLLSRIDSLPTAAQRVLTVAAVIGDPTDPTLLTRAIEPTLNMATFEEALTILEDRNLLYQSWGSIGYHFHHALMRDVAYASMRLEERQRTHRRLVELLATAPDLDAADREPMRNLELLAHHAFYAVVTSRTEEEFTIAAESSPTQRRQALHYLRQSGERAQQKYAIRNAIVHYQRALTIVATLPTAMADQLAILDKLGACYEIVMALPQAIHALQQVYEYHTGTSTTQSSVELAALARRIGRLYERQSDYETALTWIERGLAHLPDVDGAPLTPEEYAAAAALHVRRGCVRYSQGNHHEAAIACQRGLDLMTDLPAGAVQAEAHNLLGSIADLQGETSAAGDDYRAGLAIYRILGNGYEVARVENNLALICFRTGEWAAAKEHFQRGIAFWEEIEDQYNLAFNRLNLSVIAMYQGEWAVAEAGFRQALAIWSAAQNQRWSALCYTNLGLLAIEQQAWQEAHAYLAESRALIMQQAIHHFLPEVTYAMAEVALGEGNHLRAQELADEALTLARSLAMRLEEAIALRIQGKISLACGDLPAAAAHLQASLAQLQEQQNRYEVARTLQQLSRLATAMGKSTEAATYAQEATTLFHALGAVGSGP